MPPLVGDPQFFLGVGVVRVAGVAIFSAEHFLEVVAMTLLADGFAQGGGCGTVLF